MNINEIVSTTDTKNTKEAKLEIIITNAKEEHYKEWKELWDQYGDFHLSEEVTKVTWQKIISSNAAINCLVALLDKEVIGFITFVEHDCTWEINPICYVEDLYVKKLKRGPKYNVANKLMDELLKMFHQGQWSRIYGITRDTNKLAQKLYNQHSEGELYLRYVIKKEN